jgi:choline dehydrogenase
MNARDGVRVSTAVAYLHPARHRLNLTIRPHCLVNRVLLEGDRAVGLEVECGGEVQRVHGRRITLSAGAVASPAILLRSGIGPRAELEALGIEPLVDLPGVGRNLIDHVWAGVRAIPKPGVCIVPRPTVQIGVRYTAPGSGEFNDMQLYMASNADLRPFPEVMALTGSPTIFSVYAVLQRPRSRGRLTLTSADPHEQPRIELNYLDDPDDLRRLVEGVRLCWQVVHEPEIVEQTERLAAPEPAVMASEEAIEEYVKRTCSTLFHPVGTARMGPDGDPDAVVDQFCRVRGVRGLNVVDASIMPNIIRANTNLTCIMVGERAADLMREDARDGVTSHAR